MLIRDAALELGRNIVIVASGDLSHKLQEYGPYGFAPEGPVYDERIMDIMERAAFGELFDFDETFLEKAAECGHRAFVIMAGAFDGMQAEAKRLSHQDVTGVGYGVCLYTAGQYDPQRHFLAQYLEREEEQIARREAAEDAYVKLARQSIDFYIRDGRIMDVPENLPDELSGRRAGAFVSLHMYGRLRGCIGTISATAPTLAEEIIQNAVSACSRDPRFAPVTEEELPFLDCSVDVLGEAEPIVSPADLDVHRYGVIVSNGRRRGLLLPDLDGVDTVEQQIDIARQKAGIAKSEQYSLERFEVVRHHAAPDAEGD